MAAVRIVLLPPVDRRARWLQTARRVGFSCAWLPRLSIASNATGNHWTFVDKRYRDRDIRGSARLCLALRALPCGSPKTPPERVAPAPNALDVPPAVSDPAPSLGGAASYDTNTGSIWSGNLDVGADLLQWGDFRSPWA